MNVEYTKIPVDCEGEDEIIVIPKKKLSYQDFASVFRSCVGFITNPTYRLGLHIICLVLMCIPDYSNILQEIKDTHVIVSFGTPFCFAFCIAVTYSRFLDFVHALSSSKIYTRQILVAFQDAFNQSVAVSLVSLLVLGILSLRYSQVPLDWFIKATSVFTLLILIFHHIMLKWPTTMERTIVSKNLKTGIGRALAMSYYLGYLNLMISERSNGNLIPDFLQRVQQYEAKNNVSIAVHKLFILIPKSCTVTPELVTSVDTRLKPCKANLEPKIINRAGVYRRVYHNTIYEIEPPEESEDKKSLYVVAEAVTALIPLKNMVENGKTHMNLSARQMEIEREMFIETLEELFKQDADCQELCVLVDFPDRDDEGNLVPISDVLEAKIKELTANKKQASSAA